MGQKRKHASCIFHAVRWFFTPFETRYHSFHRRLFRSVDVPTATVEIELQSSTLPETNSKSPWKSMVGRQVFPFGARPIFREELAALGSVAHHFRVSYIPHLCWLLSPTSLKTKYWSGRLHHCLTADASERRAQFHPCWEEHPSWTTGELPGNFYHVFLVLIGEAGLHTNAIVYQWIFSYFFE